MPRVHFCNLHNFTVTLRALSKEKVRLLAVYFSFFSLNCSLLFYLRVIEIYISFLDMLKRKSIRPLAFSGRFPGS